MTNEMEELNRICDGYGTALEVNAYDECLEILWQAQRYLNSLPAKTPMYRNGNKWTFAGELAEFNDRRAKMIQRLAGGRTW